MTDANDVFKKLREKAAAQGLSDSEVAEAVASAIGNVSRNMSPPHDALYHELEALAAYIKKSRQELSMLRTTSNIGTDHISSATDELDAVTEATAEATNNVINQCDILREVAKSVSGDEGLKMQRAIDDILASCNFQDITGQRIAKVVRTLKHIEDHIDKLVEVFAESLSGALPQSSGPAKTDANDESRLLNGPQLPGNASTQDEIDQLLATLDDKPSS
jgi:chemotaxis protein CheZ